jgi:hypothetical protein
MKKIIATAIAASCVVGVAQAQTTYVPDFVDQTIFTGTQYVDEFSVGGTASNLLIEGSTTAASGVTGDIVVISLTGAPGTIVASDLNFAAGNQSGDFNFQFQSLAAGAYLLGYQFTAPNNAVVPVGFAASVESTYTAPEIDPASAISGLTLLVGGLLVFRGRRPATPTFA